VLWTGSVDSLIPLREPPENSLREGAVPPRSAAVPSFKAPPRASGFADLAVAVAPARKIRARSRAEIRTVRRWAAGGGRRDRHRRCRARAHVVLSGRTNTRGSLRSPSHPGARRRTPDCEGTGTKGAAHIQRGSDALRRCCFSPSPTSPWPPRPRAQVERGPAAAIRAVGRGGRVGASGGGMSSSWLARLPMLLSDHGRNDA
jgi:hypothetical protein